MRKKPHVFNMINTRILLVLLVLFIIIAGVIGVVNNINIRGLYEESYTRQLLLANALMGEFIRSGDIEYFVELMKNQGDEFKQRQVDFYHNREELFKLQREDAPQHEQQAMMDKLAEFHTETNALKSESYWTALASLKELKEISGSTFVYVMADTGLETRDGETLYTYIFDAEDDGEYSSPDMDGLGTSDVGNEAFTNVFLTKKQTEKAELYQGDLGELYFVCTPILDENGEVTAILGTDLSLDDMNDAIALSTALFNLIIIAISIISGVTIYILLSRSIAKPLSSLTETAIVFAEGNLHTPISESALRQHTEIGMLAHAFKSTLDATTLYLNSVPEGLFIMNRKLETYFRNEQFIKRFGEMQAREFMQELLPDNTKDELEKQLRQENNTIIVWINGSCYAVMLKEIVLNELAENSVLVIANDITELMREKENAQAAATAKSNFLSRMSHEMRTPMNAIIGMSNVAGDSESMGRIKYCVSMIRASSEQLLSIINDVLDMSKIEAGKLVLEEAPINLEKTLMKVCGVIFDAMEKKEQKLNIVLSRDLKLLYIADDLRLSQVLTNLLSNAVKFTPEYGSITLTAENTSVREHTAVLRISVSDTGIGMADSQISRLFNAFEQADGSISRKYGGAGLGLAISQSIIEKMGGRIEVESEPGAGSTFSFSVPLEYIPHQDIVSFDGVRPGDIRALVIENDSDARKHLTSIIESLDISADSAGNAAEAFALLDSARKAGRAYDIIFISNELPDTSGIQIINQLSGSIDKRTVVAVTTYLEWHHIEKYAQESHITRYITKPVLPSAVSDAINEIVVKARESSETETDVTDELPDLSNVRILLAEDIDINREVFLALMEGTNVSTDIAENGLDAVSKFKENPKLFDLIFMDIQMPEMDGYEATKAIRALDVPEAASVPIIAMSANAFKEDVELCIKSGMNDHIAKPIDVGTMFKKITHYLNIKL